MYDINHAYQPNRIIPFLIIFALSLLKKGSQCRGRGSRPTELIAHDKSLEHHDNPEYGMRRHPWVYQDEFDISSTWKQLIEARRKFLAL